MTASQKYEPQAFSRSARTEIRGVNYHVLEWGNSEQPLLFMLHGWGDCGASFQFVVDELQKDWFVVAPDWRGFGRSRIRCTSYWFPDYVADLHVLLAHYQSDKPVHLLGHSMGANIAGLYAGIFPDRVASFVNVEGFGLV
ncbi:MAG: alpha/beta fold hydrolase, partial [Woeseia sp.]|nr:alpha/beta fold hydrolase [Woeseia sp.]